MEKEEDGGEGKKEEGAEPEEGEHQCSLQGTRTEGGPAGRAPVATPASGWPGQTESGPGFGAWQTRNFEREKWMEKFGGLRFPVM